MIGVPSSLKGCTRRSPSSIAPLWHRTTATTGRPSCQVVISTPSVRSSGARGACSRKRSTTSRAWLLGKSRNPASTVVSGWSWNSNDVTMPKLPPPPRTPQKSSGFSSALARKQRPSATTTSTADTLSHARPCFRISHPWPPPSVSPATPVEETIPPVVASPWRSVAVSKSFHVSPGSAVIRRRRGSTWADVIGAGTAGDEGRAPVDHPVPDGPRLVVAGVAAHNERPGQTLPEVADRALLKLDEPGEGGGSQHGRNGEIDLRVL